MSGGIEIENVTQRYGDDLALDDVSLSVPEGGFTVLLGPSGSGKTTLLSLIGGFIPAQAGRIAIGGRDMVGIGPAKRPTATVFQDYALFPHMTIAENIGFGLRMAGRPKTERLRRAAEMLDLVGLPDLAARKPHALSGGQKQRIALARALAVEPQVLLLDEPLGALDLKLRRQMQAELTAIHWRVGSTFVHVTHDQEEAMAIADTVVVMQKGRIADIGPPEDVYLKPRSLFSAGFVGLANIIRGAVIEASGGGAAMQSRLGALSGLDRTGALEAGADCAIVIRPEHFSVRQAGDTSTARGRRLTEARIVDITFMGTHRMARCEADGGGDTLTVQLPQTQPLQPGQRIELSYDQDRAVILPETP